MPTVLRIEEHVAAILAAADVLRQAADRAGFDAPVPSGHGRLLLGRIHRDDRVPSGHADATLSAPSCSSTPGSEPR